MLKINNIEKTTSGVAGGPDYYTTLKPYAAEAANGIKATVPARGVVYMIIDKK